MKDVLLYLDELLVNDDTVVVAVSGGPDSMCLLHLLCEVKNSKRIKIVVAHVNHKLRQESEVEAKFVKQFCKKNSLIYEYMEIDKYNGDNVENYAREKRYNFFKKLTIAYHAKYLMTAHHGDDLIETILMRLTRGSSIKGYGGFRRLTNTSNYILVRPLINVTKDDIIQYMDQMGYKYYIDKSNYSRDYTRNRYRQDVLPFLKKENPNVHLKFVKFSQKLAMVDDFLTKYIEEIIPNLKEKNGLRIDKLLELDTLILRKVIQYYLDSIYEDWLFLINDKHCDAIISLVRSINDSGSINLPKGCIALKEYNYLKIVNNSKSNAYNEVFDNELRVPGGIIKKISESDSKSNYVIRLRSEDIKLPIRVRTRLNGDRMHVKNMEGSKKVSDIFINEKVPSSLRDTFPIVVDSDDNILWLPGVKKSKFDVERYGIYDIILSYEEEI